MQLSDFPTMRPSSLGSTVSMRDLADDGAVVIVTETAIPDTMNLLVCSGRLAGTYELERSVHDLAGNVLEGVEKGALILGRVEYRDQTPCLVNPQPGDAFVAERAVAALKGAPA